VSTTAFRATALVLASLSIGCLLLYFYGVGRFDRITPVLLGIEIVGLIALSRRSREHAQLLGAGLWAGCLATLAYDLVRVPLVHGGMPVFKAISYFGTVLLGVDSPTVASEILGWAFHLSNGISFGLMYAVLVKRPNVVTAILWGLLLEGVMLLTPYAEVFGYARDATFFTITIGAHAVYGFVLWLALTRYPLVRVRWPVFVLVPLALGIMAADFYQLYANRLPASPPPRLGRHLRTTWNVPEPDRLAVLWLMRRHVDPAAEFHFIEPFEQLRFGVPLDVPEAEVRRQGTLSAMEVLLARDRTIPRTERMLLLARTTHLAEVAKWMLIGDREATREVEFLRAIAARHCGEKLHRDCLEPLFAELDRRYGGAP
jgi:hypothetical protein